MRHTIWYIIRSLAAICFKGWAGSNPIFSFLYRKDLYCADPDIIVDAYPRSANSYFAWAIELKEVPVVMSHHLHSRFQITRAIKKRIPLIVLIRNPLDACLSSAVYNDINFITLELIKWQIFYKKVLANLPDEGIKILNFEDIISEDINLIINNVFLEYGVKVPKNITPQEIKDTIYETNIKQHDSVSESARKITLPSKRKELYKKELKSNLKNVDKYILKQNEKIYNEICNKNDYYFE